MIHSYKSLATPIAQMAAAERFCAGIHAFFEDLYQGADVEVTVTPTAVLDRLACLGLRFETDGGNYKEGSDSFFVWSRGVAEEVGGPILTACLYAYAELLAEDLEENGLICYLIDGDSDSVYERPNALQVVTLHGCVLDNLIFVPDFEHVASRAYFLALIPGRLPKASD